MLQIMLFLIHTRYKYQKHKPDKYLINIQQSLNYSIYSSTTKRKKKKKKKKIITKSYK
ncbi:YkiB [Escherichia coli]|nr:YkiB [Escherichia coli]